MAWSNGLAEWIEGDTAFLSVVFSWRLPDAYQRAKFYLAEGYKVRAGGPAIFNVPHYLEGVAELPPEKSEGWIPDAISHHNALATIASRGCPGMGTVEHPKPCTFCIVPKMQGTHFTYVRNFEPRPILCDNNLSALPIEYQEFIIDKYRRSGVSLLDANSGFEPATFDAGTYRRWKEILRGPWRFGYDTLKERDNVYRMMQLLKVESPKRKQVYVILGTEPFDSCYQRVREVIEWGGEPCCQPFMDLNTLVRKPRPRFDWTERTLMDMARWVNRHIWRAVPRFEEYAGSRSNPEEIPDTQLKLIDFLNILT